MYQVRGLGLWVSCCDLTYYRQTGMTFKEKPIITRRNLLPKQGYNQEALHTGNDSQKTAFHSTNVRAVTWK